MVSLHIQYLESSQGPGTNWPTASPQAPVPQRGLLKLPTQGPSSPSQAAVPEDGFTLSVKAGWTCSASHCDNRDMFFGGLRFLLRSPTLCKSLLDGEDPDYWRTWHMVGYFINTGRMNAHGWLSSKHLPSGPAWREGTKPSHIGASASPNSLTQLLKRNLRNLNLSQIYHWFILLHRFK